MPELALSHPTLALLVGAAFVAGWIDAIAGGGGLITVPALLAAGLPPHVALATNKGQSVFGAITSLLRFARSGLIDRKRAKVAFPTAFVGALIGVQLVLWVSPSALKPVVLGLLVCVALFLTVRRNQVATHARVALRQPLRWAAIVAFVIGAYDGFFGPGTGTFLIVAHVLWFDVDLTRASANGKVVNFASNLASVALFGWSGTIAWRVALPMAVAQLIGAYLGARLAVSGGDRVVKPVVLSVVLALVSKLAYDLLG